MVERQWTGGGPEQLVEGERLAGLDARFQRELDYAQKANVHLWVVTTAHRATDAMLDAFEDPEASPLLDAETLLMAPVLGCYICEQPYTRRLRLRRCTGQPRSDGRWPRRH